MRNVNATPDVTMLAEGPLGDEEERSHRRIHAPDRVEQCAEIVVVVALAIEVVAMFGNVIFRRSLNSSLLWSLEVGELALVVMTFVGGAIAYPRNEHMALHAVGAAPAATLARRHRGLLPLPGLRDGVVRRRGSPAR